MEKIEREIQKCINRFEFALLIYYDSNNGLKLYHIFGILEELFRHDLLKSFRKHSISNIGEEK